MKAVSKILAGGLGIAALAAAAPAAAQYYPGYPGGGYGGYGQGGVVGQILESILGNRRYATNDRYAIDMCVRATEARLNGQGNYGYDPRYGGYGGGGAYGGYGGYGYDPRNSYGTYGYGGARVVRVTHVERRQNGGLKVYGLADSPQNNYGGYGGGYGGYGNYGYGSSGYYNTTADFRFNCKIDYRGRVTDVDIDRNRNVYRGY